MRDMTVWRPRQLLPWITVGMFVARVLGGPAVAAGAELRGCSLVVEELARS